MPKDKKSKKQKAGQKNKERASRASSSAGASVVSSVKGSAVANVSKQQRQEIGGPAFYAEVGKLRDQFMKQVSKKEDQRKSAKADVKQALQTCLDLSGKALKQCGTASATYLLEHIQADAEKLKIHLAQDEDYIEEVRFKHNKLMDLLDDTRAYDPVNLQKDLVRNREIRGKCYQLTHGDTPQEQLVDEDEMNELLKIRNSIRTWYGGQNMLKGMGGIKNDGGDGDKALFQMNPSEIKVASGKVA